jgi:LacI family transcriptional regulator
VVSFDGSELAGWLRPRLTSVTIPYADLGARAVEMLLDTKEQGPSVIRVPMPVARGTSVLRAL